jgi:glycosyltransferase involved in cell wall biosynthesis
MAEKIGVLFIQAQTTFGADAAVHADLMRFLDRDEFTVHVACTKAADDGSVPPSLSALEKVPDIRLQQVRFAPSLSQLSLSELEPMLRAGIGFPRDFLALRKYIADENISIVHGSDRPRSAAYTVLLAKLARRKSVVHVHVHWASGYGFVPHRSLLAADAAFGISRYVTDSIVASGKPASRVPTILNAIDLRRWDPNLDGSAIRNEFGIPRSAPLLVSVSRLFPQKGQRELVNAFALVKKTVPDARLMIVGADELYAHQGSFTAELKTLAAELGVADHVVFTGGRSDIPAIMAAADVFTLPSFEEPFGLVFLEAMAMRRPVIAINNGGTPEVVEHGKSGLLSEAWNVPELASNIVKLLEDPELRARMGDYGRARVVQHFDAPRMARDAANAYKSLLGR